MGFVYIVFFIFNLKTSLAQPALNFSQTETSHPMQKLDACLNQKNIKLKPTQPEEFDCHFLKRNLKRDSFKPLISAQEAFDFESLKKQNTETKVVSIQGSNRYAGILPLPYRYELKLNGIEKIVIQVRVHFKNLKSEDLQDLEKKFHYAELIWNNFNPFYRNLTFQFKIEHSAQNAHFSVALKDRLVRGPYHQRWSKKWGFDTIAHELGHMMGLDDEYPHLTVVLQGQKFIHHLQEYGNLNSLMFNTTYSHFELGPRLYHYYLILRRAHKSTLN